MNRTQANNEAHRRWGYTGFTRQHGWPTYDCYVADYKNPKKKNIWGVGATWEEAFADAEMREGDPSGHGRSGERAEALIRQMGELAEKSLSEEKNVTAEDKQEVAHKIQDAIEAFRSSRRANDVKDVQ